jgi:hypothetical protein
MSIDSLKYGSSVHSSNGLFGDTVRTTAPPATGRVIKTSTRISTPMPPTLPQPFGQKTWYPVRGSGCGASQLAQVRSDTRSFRKTTIPTSHLILRKVSRREIVIQHKTPITFIHTYMRIPNAHANKHIPRNAMPRHTHTPTYQGLDRTCSLPDHPRVPESSICVLHARAAGTDGDDD